MFVWLVGGLVGCLVARLVAGMEIYVDYYYYYYYQSTATITGLLRGLLLVLAGESLDLLRGVCRRLCEFSFPTVAFDSTIQRLSLCLSLSLSLSCILFTSTIRQFSC